MTRATYGLWFFVLTLGISNLALAARQMPLCQRLDNDISASGPTTQKFKNVLRDQWEYEMHESPESATHIGYPGLNDRWSDLSLSAIERRRFDTKCQIVSLKKLNRNELAGEDRITYDLVLRNLAMDDEGSQFGGEFLVLSHISGIHIDLPGLLDRMPKGNKRDFENILARLEKVPSLIAQTQVLLGEGLKRKVTPVKMFLERVPGQFDRVLTLKVEESPLYSPFVDIGGEISDEDKAILRRHAHEVIEGTVYPALKGLRKYLVETYIPGAREAISFSTLPNGQAWYNYLVRFHTTTKKTAQELHDLGRQEVTRISAEMQKIKEQVKFTGTRAEFNQYLLKEDKFFFKTEEDLLTAYRSFGKEVDAELPRFFGVLPRLPYGVHAMPAYKANESPAAYYIGGSLAAGRAAFFEANTSNLRSRPKWAVQALTLHEAVPGHHLQISLAQEIEGLPEVRRFGGYTAFVEGWGLYAESLGAEMGFYKDPYSMYGRYSMEIWRAVRLVVDTGIHALGWSREKAINYFLENVVQTRKEAEVEVDRYITWPGQALAYKVGQLKFQELREKSRAQLGEKFDVRKFHDEVLKHGALPLDVLEKIF